MSRMIRFCAACSAQNFVSEERDRVAGIPPRCWKCGEILPLTGETDPAGGESKIRTGIETPGGGASDE